MFSDAVKKSRKVQQHFEFPVVGLDFQVFAVIKSGTGAKIIDEMSIFGTKDLWPLVSSTLKARTTLFYPMFLLSETAKTAKPLRK